nr:copper amine oxidase N-terminal domain-containing protein [Acetivibrio straminisolvens]
MLDVPANVIEGRTMVPLRFVSENMDAKVEWDGNAKIVYIYY